MGNSLLWDFRSSFVRITSLRLLLCSPCLSYLHIFSTHFHRFFHFVSSFELILSVLFSSVLSSVSSLHSSPTLHSSLSHRRSTIRNSLTAVSFLCTIIEASITHSIYSCLQSPQTIGLDILNFTQSLHDHARPRILRAPLHLLLVPPSRIVEID